MKNDPLGVVVDSELRPEVAFADVDVVTEPEGGDGRNLVAGVSNLFSLHDAPDPDPVEELHLEAIFAEREVEFDRQSFAPAERAIQKDQMGAARPPLRIDPGSAAAAVELNDPLAQPAASLRPLIRMGAALPGAVTVTGAASGSSCSGAP